MTAVEGGSIQFVPGDLLPSEMPDMYLIGPENTRIWTDSNRNFSLRQYSRMEYGTPDVSWIIASANAARARHRASRASPSRLRLRLRYFLNSFRGFAAFDVHGHDDTECD